MTSPKHNVFLFAHQDDEFGVFKVIEDCIKAAERASFIYLTSGTISGLPSAPRNNESIKILSKLGVKREDIYFLGADNEFSDGDLYKNLFEANQALNELFSKIGPPDNLYIHAWEGGHQDHDAVHILGLVQALKHECLSATKEFSLYNGFAMPWIFYRVLSPIVKNTKQIKIRLSWKERWRYLRCCCGYPSQFKSWIGLFPFVLINYLISGHQLLQNCHLKNILKSPHHGVLLYEARKSLTYEQFDNSVREFYQQKCFEEFN